MSHPIELDEQTLAAFISGALPEEEHRTVLFSLLRDEEARQWLHMACEALAVARQKSEPPAHPDFAYSASRPALRCPDRPALRAAPRPQTFMR